MQRRATLTINPSNAPIQLECSGVWDKETIASLPHHYKSLASTHSAIVCDLSKITSIDTAGAMFLLHVKECLSQNATTFTFVGESEKVAKILSLCEKNYAPFPTPPKQPFVLSKWFHTLGHKTQHYITSFFSFLSFVGGVSQAFLKTLVLPHKMRVKATLYHMEQSGLNAMPIIALTSLLIGIVIAYQGAVQLEKFGANIFIVEMVGISATRELAPLIAAIVVAGRSASSFTAQIGVMKITDEVDAMKTMGFGPWEFLVLPRVIALMVVMPLIVIFADAISVLGGMIIAKSQLGISFSEFMDRFQEVIALKHIMIGLIKAPIFGWIIALIGCFRGFQIDSSTESVGKYTTISVVNAIFWVIAFNALFSVFLTELGI